MRLNCKTTLSYLVFCMCVMEESRRSALLEKTLQWLHVGASSPLLSLWLRCSFNSPWFEVPGSDRILLSKNKNTQYFPPEHIVESDTSALWTKTLHRLLSRSPKWKGKVVSSKRLLKSSRYPHSEGHSRIHRSSWVFSLQPSRTSQCGEGLMHGKDRPLRTKNPTEL